MKQRQWPWFGLQITTFLLVWGIIHYAMAGEKDFGHAPALFAAVAALVVTLVVSWSIELFAFLARLLRGLVRNQNQPSSSDLRLPRSDGARRDIPQNRPSLRIGKDVR